MNRPCTLILGIAEYEDKEDEFEWECELDPSDGAGGIVSFPDKNFKKNEFESGVSTLFGDIEIDRNGKARINGNPIFGRRERNKSKGRDLASLGNRTVLAIRVVGNDIATTANEATISNEIFGTSGDIFNLKTGYTECSFGALNFEPTPDEPDRLINGGVYTVVLNENIAGLSRTQLRDKVVAKGNAELGTMSSQFDHVMLCLPPIAGFDGIAYAYVNSWLSYYKDVWCNYPSSQLHELGHNLGLGKCCKFKETISFYWNMIIF